jgi:hypothetical protein
MMRKNMRKKRHQSTQNKQRNQQCFAVQFVTRLKKIWEIVRKIFFVMRKNVSKK